MRVRYLASAAVTVETEDATVLCDPWLVDGAYFGSWCHYPPLPYRPEDFADVDYIYVSHVHPDHFDERTLRRMDADAPVLIHDYRWDYLRDAIEALGYEVWELPHDERVHLTGDLHVNVLAADGCDPAVCGNFFGCTWYDDGADEHGSTQVDSMAVFDDGEYTVVDTNDCPFPIAEDTFRQVKQRYGHVDLLAHQYSAAQFYPQAMEDYTPAEKRAAAREVALEKHRTALQFLDLFEPDFYLPFAGEYTLAGSLAHLNEFTANPPREAAAEWFAEHAPDEHTCVFLNSGEYLDLESGEPSMAFRPVDPAAKRRYVREVLAGRTFDYETDPLPDLAELQSYVPAAYGNLEDKRRRVGFASETTVLVPLRRGVELALSLDGSGYEYVEEPDLDTYERYVRLNVDPRLLRRIFEGPERAYWADAKIGSHVGVSKEPDVYERGLYNCMNAFHT